MTKRWSRELKNLRCAASFGHPTHKKTKGLLGDVKTLRFATVLDVRQAQSDEKVAQAREELAFRHSFGRPTTTK